MISCFLDLIRMNVTSSYFISPNSYLIVQRLDCLLSFSRELSDETAVLNGVGLVHGAFHSNPFGVSNNDSL